MNTIKISALEIQPDVLSELMEYVLALGGPRPAPHPVRTNHGSVDAAQEVTHAGAENSAKDEGQ